MIPRVRTGANFIFMRSLRPPAEANEIFLRAGVVVRPQPGLDWTRVSIGRPEDNDRFLEIAATALRP